MTHCAGVHRHHVHPSSRVALIKNVEYARQLRAYRTAVYLVCNESYGIYSGNSCYLITLFSLTQDTVQTKSQNHFFFFKQGESLYLVFVLIPLRMFCFTQRINRALTLFGNVCIESRNHFFSPVYEERVTRTALATLAGCTHPLSKD